MPKWLLVSIITLLGGLAMFAAYRVTTNQLDAEHERKIRNLVVQYGQAQASEASAAPETKRADNDTPTSTSGLDSSDAAIIASGTAIDLPIDGDPTDIGSSDVDFSVEIGAITIENVRFEVGASWQNEDQSETYTITKIIQRATGVDLIYQTSNEQTYLFQMTQDPNNTGSFTIVGAPPALSLGVNTTPDADEDDLSDTAQADPTTTNPTTEDSPNSESENATVDQATNPSNNEPAASEAEYEIVYTTPTSSPTDTSNETTTSDLVPDPAPSSNPQTPDTEEETSSTTEPVSLAPTSTTPTTTPDAEPEPNQPFNDGTYQYKADAQFVPYTPPLYDRTPEDNEVSIAP